MTIAAPTADRLALQNLINAYCQESQRGVVVTCEDQSGSQRAISGGHPILLLALDPISLPVMVPISQCTRLGLRQFLDMPYVFQDGSWVQIAPVTLASLIIEDIIHTHPDKDHLDGADVMARWLQSYQALESILASRGQRLDDIIDSKASFIASEQSLIYGHAMHPTPKSRVGFDQQDWQAYSPETKGRFQLSYWLVDPECIVEEFVDGESITAELKKALIPMMSADQRQLVDDNPSFKLLPLHPWQARHLQKQSWFDRLVTSRQLVELKSLGWYLSATTSVRTLAAFDAPWMFKLSLSVAITNSVRINLPKECKRGLHACRIWRSDFGGQLQSQYPTLKVLNDPAWVALRVDGEIIEESICIFRDNPFLPHDQVSNLASLCQDHPNKVTNRLKALLDEIHSTTDLAYQQIAQKWFTKFLDVAVEPLLQLYHDHGFGFEAHQQNSLIELEEGYPKRFWLRDNQGFGYVIEYAGELIERYPELEREAQCIVPAAFADDRVIYYFVGNSLFGMISALAKTGYIKEDELLLMLADRLGHLQSQFPSSALIDSLLNAPTLPYKGNLMTRLYQLDELTAPVESQSVYVQIPNPIKAVRDAKSQHAQEVSYA